MPIILAIQEAEIRRFTGAKSSQNPILKNPITKEKIRLVEWLKVKALSSSPSTTKEKKKKERKNKTF
jgi:hypothetical protein